MLFKCSTYSLSTLFNEYLFSLGEKYNKSIYLFGAKPEVLKALKEKLENEYKGLKIIGCCDGYKENKDKKQGISPAFLKKHTQIMQKNTKKLLTNSKNRRIMCHNEPQRRTDHVCKQVLLLLYV